MAPDDEAEALHRRAVALMNLRRYAQALPLLERAVGLAMENAKYTGDLSVTLDRVGRPADALAAIERVLTLSPLDGWAHRFHSYLLGRLGRPEDAYLAARRAVALAPYSADAHRRLSLAARESDRVDEIEVAARRAVELAPESATVWWNYGTLLGELGNATASRGALREALRRSPTNAGLHLEHAQGLDGEARVAAFREVLALDPVHTGALGGYALALSRMGRHDEALAVARSLAGVTKSPTWDLYPVLLVAFAAGVHARWLDEVWDDARERTAAAPRDVAAWKLRGWVALHRADRDEAASAARTALALGPPTASLVEQLGHALRGTPESVALYERARSLEPQHGWYAAAVAEVMWESGDHARALDAARAAVALHPREPHAWRVLGALAASARAPELLDCAVAPRSLELHAHDALEASGHLARARGDRERAALCYADAEATNDACCCARVSAALARAWAGDHEGARQRLALAEVVDPFCGCAGARDELRQVLGVV